MYKTIKMKFLLNTIRKNIDLQMFFVYNKKTAEKNKKTVDKSGEVW